MKRILLSAVVLSSIGVYAQELPVKTDHAVGIETTQPRATLDVNGNLRVQNTSESKIPANEDCPCFLVVDGNGEVKRVPIGKGTGIGTGVGTGPGTGTTTSSDGTTIIGGVSPKDGGVANPYVLTPDETLELDWSTYDSNLRTVELSVNLPADVPYSAYMSPTIEIPTVDGGKRKVSITYPKGTTDGSKKITATLLFDGKYVPKLIFSESEAERYEIPLYFNGVKQTAKMVLRNGLNAVKNTENGAVFTYPVVKIENKYVMAMNMGARYAKEATTNPGVLNEWRGNAMGGTDYKAYGSLFQPGRAADGHEQMLYTGYATGRRANPSIELYPPDQLQSKPSDKTWVCPPGWRVLDFTIAELDKFDKKMYLSKNGSLTRGRLSGLGSRVRTWIWINDKKLFDAEHQLDTERWWGTMEADRDELALPLRCLRN